jgi:hypothetical protein
MKGLLHVAPKLTSRPFNHYFTHGCFDSRWRAKQHRQRVGHWLPRLALILKTHDS